ncbi:MAG: Rpn family recombination-promoting nuclease/putative transposase [Bacteroidales bacterium]|nr:Rpn family recombination-promoting nuclease/putative transposase [Bacteroidales bacterium]
MPIKYLDPKNDLTFRKIFGEHPHLLISFLNALLPLEKGREILNIEYIDSEILPELPGLKRSVVDVRCVDNHDRQFIVEMQMYWTSSFKSRMLFNTSKAYVRQLFKKEKFSELRPVYGLSLLNEDFMKEDSMKEVYYHHYRMVHNIDSKECIPGIELIFIELQKFKSLNYTDRRLQVLWLKFLTLIDENTTVVPEELQSDTNIVEALEHLNYASFTEQELNYYEKYWDAIRIEKSSIADAIEKAEESIKKAAEEIKLAAENEAKALAEKAEALAEKELALKNEANALAKESEAIAKAEKERAEKESALSKIVQIVKNLSASGMTKEAIAKMLSLTIEEVENCLNR